MPCGQLRNSANTLLASLLIITIRFQSVMFRIWCFTRQSPLQSRPSLLSDDVLMLHRVVFSSVCPGSQSFHRISIEPASQPGEGNPVLAIPWSGPANRLTELVLNTAFGKLHARSRLLALQLCDYRASCLYSRFLRARRNFILRKKKEKPPPASPISLWAKTDHFYLAPKSLTKWNRGLRMWAEWEWCARFQTSEDL